MRALQELLYPWYDALRTMTATVDGTTLWLHSPRLDGLMLEAVALATWLAHVSFDEFTVVEQELWMPSSVLFVDANRRTQPREYRHVGLRISPKNRVDLDQITPILLQRHTRPSGFVDAHYQLQLCLQSQDPTQTGRLQTPVRVDLDRVKRLSPTDKASMLQRFVETVQAQRLVERVSRGFVSHGVELRITEVHIGQLSIHVTAVQQLARLQDLDVKLRGFSERSLGAPTSVQGSVSLLESLLQTSDRVPCVGINELSLSLDASHSELVPRLFSAIASSRSLRSISIAISGWQLREHKVVAWIGYALFSRCARHRIENVKLAFETATDVQAMVNAVLAGDALTILFDRLAPSIREFQHLRAAASRFKLFDPATELGAGSVIVSHPHQDLRILGRLDASWCVLLPGWGQAWVDDADVVISPCDSASNVNWKPAIRRLEILMKLWLRLEDIAMLLEVIGHGTESMQLAFRGTPHEAVTTSSWARLVSTLPQLRKLRLVSVPLRDLDALTDAMWEYGGQRLPQLELSTCIDSDLRPVKFAEAFSDATHPLAQSLETLGIRLATNPYHTIRGLDESLATILANSTRLANFVLEASGAQYFLRQQVEQIHDRLQQYNHERLPHAQAVWMREKVAFLSAAWSSRSCGSSIKQLDRVVVAMILQYAARPTRRRVRVLNLPDMVTVG